MEHDSKLTDVPYTVPPAYVPYMQYIVRTKIMASGSLIDSSLSQEYATKAGFRFQPTEFMQCDT
jgi:hypothetical protein